MRRFRKWQFGMMVGICVCAWCGTGQAVISSHLTWISLRQGQGFSSSTATTPGYFFVLRLRTDSTVTSVEFTTPASLTYTIPNTPHACCGNVHTAYKTWRTNIYAWEYQAWFDSIAGLHDYGDGTYTIKLNYASGGPDTTTVAYVVPNTSNPIPQPAQKPNITSPTFGTSLVPPVSFAWDACTDPNVDSTNGIAVEVYDSDDTDKLPKLYAKTVTNTNSDPCGLDDGQRSAQVMFQKRYTFNNAHGIACEVLKGSATMHEFEGTYSKVYRFHLASNPLCRFWTVHEDEKNKLLALYPTGWLLDGSGASYFHAYAGNHADNLVEVYRLFNVNNNDHLYTASAAERDRVLAQWPTIYTDEGVGFYAYLAAARPAETVAVYRLWQSSNLHYYTISLTERNQMLGTGWLDEGIAFYTYP